MCLIEDWGPSPSAASSDASQLMSPLPVCQMASERNYGQPSLESPPATDVSTAWTAAVTCVSDVRSVTCVRHWHSHLVSADSHRQARRQRSAAPLIRFSGTACLKPLVPSCPLFTHLCGRRMYVHTYCCASVYLGDTRIWSRTGIQQRDPLSFGAVLSYHWRRLEGYRYQLASTYQQRTNNEKDARRKSRAKNVGRDVFNLTRF